MKLDRRRWLALAGGVCLLPTAGAARHEQRQLFGSPVDLLLPADAPREAVASVWRGLAAMNARWNAWKPGEVAELNAAFAAGRAVTVAPALRRLVEGAAAMERMSMGRFNAGIGGLVGRWGFHDDVLRPGSRPATAQLEGWLAARPGLAQLQWEGTRVRSLNPALRLDFGAYAKGVALDWALDRLRGAGVRRALLNLGGNLAAMSDGDAPPWQVGVRDPWRPGIVARLATRGREAVVTSGIYERVRMLDGQPCGHVLDPGRGEPASALVSVTVVHADAALADAASTALLVAGPASWRGLAQRMGVDQVLVLDGQGLQQATPAMARRLL
jgi:FAD:protein FMN transferase